MSKKDKFDYFEKEKAEGKKHSSAFSSYSSSREKKKSTINKGSNKYQGTRNRVKIHPSDFKSVRERVKLGVKANTAINPRKATRNSRKSYKQAKRHYKLKKKEAQADRKLVHAFSKSAPDESSSIRKAFDYSKEKLEKKAEESAATAKDSKVDRKVAKKIYMRTKKADPTRLNNVVKTTTVATARRKVEKSAGQDDILGEGVKIRQGSRQRTHMYQSTKFLVKGSHRVTMKTGKGTYGLANRSYNFVRGRGFQKTPVEYSKVRQTAKKLRNFRQRLKMSRLGRTASSTSRITGSIVRVVNAPLKLKNAAIIGGVLLFLMFLFAIFGSLMPSTIYQDEFDLTDSWTHMTKEDAEHSDDTYLFYTNFDDVMFYMNYKYEDYKLTDRIVWYRFKIFREYLSDLWKDMNDLEGDYTFTSMDDLMKDKDSPYYLKPEEYEELRELVNEFGYLMSSSLSFPFKTDSLPIARRYGYEVAGEQMVLHENIQVKVESNTEIFAPMSGKIRWTQDQKQVIIESEEDQRIFLTGVTAPRHDNNQSVKDEELIGRASSDLITISYEKYDTEQKKWRRVNPAFYFPKVTYLQTTVITENFEPEGDRLKNAKYIHTQLKKLGYDDKGIAAMLGNFDVESSINPKRAEGDYLSPPVGASKDSWDDPAWLSMGGMDIYGKYPNILHRGLGLGQWTDTTDGSTRHTLLLDFAKQKKKKWYTLPLQLDFMLNGDTPGYRAILKNTLSAKAGDTVADLTRYFLMRWEGNPGDKLKERIQAAENWYQYFTRTAGDGDYILPIDPPKISSWYGNRYLGGSVDFHRGLDFAHPQGTPVKAIADGEVIAAEYHYSWGNYVRIKHKNGHCSLYAHNSQLKVKVGDQVKQGDIISLVGNTGNSFGAHLHLEYSTSTDLSINSLMDPAVILGIKK
ncbi:TPA: phage tail tip lysozyme [Enterococcus hirae]